MDATGRHPLDAASTSSTSSLDADVVPTGNRLTPWTFVAGLALGACAVVAIAVSDKGDAFVIAVPLVASALVAVVDQATARIRTSHAIALAITTLVVLTIATLAGRGSFTSALLGAAIWTVPFFALAVAGAAGGGDFKYAIALGLITGWISASTAMLGLMCAVLAASTHAILVAAARRSVRVQVRLGISMYMGAMAALTVSASRAQ